MKILQNSTLDLRNQRNGIASKNKDKYYSINDNNYYCIKNIFMNTISNSSQFKNQSINKHNLSIRNKSIESIHNVRNHNSKQILQQCPLQTIRKHLNHSFEFKTQKNSSYNSKRQAYQFFDQQRRKRLDIVKQQKYLLPKICRKTKRIYLNKQNQLKFIQLEKLYTHQRSPAKKVNNVQKTGILNQKRDNTIDIDNQKVQINIKTKAFQSKCQSQLSKLQLILPQKQNLQKKRFFDLSQRQLKELYQPNVSSQHMGKDQSNKMLKSMKNTSYIRNNNSSKSRQIENQNNNSNIKFKLLNVSCPNKNNQQKKQSVQQNKIIQNNSNIPNFLLERLTIKKHGSHHTHNASFLTQGFTSKIYVSPQKCKNRDQKEQEKQSIIPTSSSKLR